MTEKEPPSELIGYARVSTFGQTLDVQLTQLKAAGSVFHFQKSARKHEQFIDAEKLNRAQELHAAFENFFAAQENA